MDHVSQWPTVSPFEKSCAVMRIVKMFCLVPPIGFRKPSGHGIAGNGGTNRRSVTDSVGRGHDSCLRLCKGRSSTIRKRPISELSNRTPRGKGLLPWLDVDGNFIGWRSRQGAGIPVLLLHGNAGHSLHRSYFVSRLRDAGVAPPIFILEYPGYGARPGTPTESNLVAAAVKAIDLLDQPVILVGESLGTGVACGAASQRPGSVRGLLLITPFDSLIAVAKKHYPWAPVSLILRDRYESSRALQKLPRTARDHCRGGGRRNSCGFRDQALRIIRRSEEALACSRLRTQRSPSRYFRFRIAGSVSSSRTAISLARCRTWKSDYFAPKEDLIPVLFSPRSGVSAASLRGRVHFLGIFHALNSGFVPSPTGC